MANVLFGLVVRGLVFCGFSVTTALAFAGAVFAQTAVNNGGSQIQQPQSNPVTSTGLCTTATGASDFAPVAQIGTNPPVNVIDPAYAYGGDVKCKFGGDGGNGGAGGSVVFNKGAIVPTATATAPTTVFGSSPITTVVNDTSTLVLPSLSTAKIGGAAPVGNYTGIVTVGDITSMISAPGKTNAGSVFGATYTDGNGVTSGGATFGRTASTEGLTPEQGLDLLATAKAVQEQQAKALEGASLFMFFRPTAPASTNVLINGQVQGQELNGKTNSARGRD